MRLRSAKQTNDCIGGRDGKWLKPGNKVKGVSFYTSGERQKFKTESEREDCQYNPDGLCEDDI